MTATYRYFTAMTLDGYLADEHDSLDWLFVQPIDDDGPMNYTAFIADIGALVMGATTYRWLVDHGESTNEPWPYEIPSFVFTHREPSLVADSIRLLGGSPAEHRGRDRGRRGGQGRLGRRGR